MQYDKQFNVRVDKDLYKKIMRQKKKQKANISKVIRDLLEKGFLVAEKRQ